MLSDFDTEGKNKLQKAVYYLKNYGMSYTTKKALRKFGIPVSEESEYMTWCRRNTASKEELEKQCGTVLSTVYLLLSFRKKAWISISPVGKNRPVNRYPL